MSEADEQRTVVEWCDWKKIPLFHIPNGGYRNKAEAAKLKRMGVRAGVPDLFMPVASGGYHGLFVEMKHGNGNPTKNQSSWISLLNSQGYMAVVCYGADDAISAISGYLAL